MCYCDFPGDWKACETIVEQSINPKTLFSRIFKSIIEKVLFLEEYGRRMRTSVLGGSMREEAVSGKKMLKYQTLKEKLKERIQSGFYRESNCLPAERELCEEYDASRMTVRKAVSELEEEGVLYKVRGKGTFIKNTGKINQTLSKLTSFSEDMEARGMIPGSKILVLDVILANEAISENLGLEVGEKVIMLRRLRLADREPMAIETTYLSHKLFADIFHRLADENSLYQLMREELGIFPKRAIQSVEVSSLMEWEASLLGNRELQAALLIHRRTFDGEGIPLEYVESKYRSDKYKFYIELYDN